MTSEILLATLNARYIHSAFGLRYLLANLDELRERSSIVEFDISHRPQEIVERLLRHNPSIIGFGVYIWNVRQTCDVLTLLRKVAPRVKIVLGGPEVSFEIEEQEIFQYCDYVVQGEADVAFKKLALSLLENDLSSPKIIKQQLPSIPELKFPYEYYSATDIDHRVIYVEASRGCPFTCEFCLSSLDIPVRQFPLDSFLSEMEKLLTRGAKQFKFVDRTFNLHLKTSKTILEFFLTRYTPGLFVHFEMVPDRLPDGLREIIVKFPPGSLQFEVGIQSFNPEVGTLISRRQDFKKIEENITFLRKNTGVHIHADLIVGLPGESLESFGEGFNRLVALDPQEIQVGILKRLRGTPIVRHDVEWEMVYNSFPPFELLSNKFLNFSAMQRMGRFSRYWDLISNSGNFKNTRSLLWTKSQNPFESFLAWSDWLYEKTGTRHLFSVKSLKDYLFEYLSTQLNLDEKIVRDSLEQDSPTQKKNVIDLPDRQARHAAG